MLDLTSFLRMKTSLKISLETQVSLREIYSVRSITSAILKVAILDYLMFHGLSGSDPS